MRKPRLFVLLILLSLGFIVACERNDDEPLKPKTPISRLYVSFSDVPTSDLEDPYPNIAVFDPAGGESFSTPYAYVSNVIRGAGIYFDPFSGRIFQGSADNQSIRSFSVNTQGAVGTGPFFRDSTLINQRDLVYDRFSKNLYVSDNLLKSVYVYSQALNRNGEIRPNKKFELTGQPWGLHLDADANGSNNLFVAIAGANAEVQLLENVANIDSGIVNASKKITISGAGDLRGVAYSSRLNMLVVTDFSLGKIYIIENARETFNTQGTISPTRIIQGAQTQLQTPIDVSIDDREDTLLIYVADRDSHKLLRFKTTDDGNVSPDAMFQFPDLTPVSIHLDAR